MNPQVILAAQQFSTDHFSNSRLHQDQFNNLIRERMRSYPLLEDRVTFLKEVIRLGNVFLSNSMKVLQHMEEQGYIDQHAAC